jgi:Chs5-Arf1p-binding protein BUD7/BCH1
MIRSILYADDESYRITGYRRLNPIPNTEAERRFLDATEKLFHLGKMPRQVVIKNRLAVGF